MKNFENLLPSFPELEESIKQSTKGGYDTYDPESDWWHNFDPYNDIINLPGVTITPGGGYSDNPYDVRNNDGSNPYGNGGGYGDYGGGSGGGGTYATPGEYTTALNTYMQNHFAGEMNSNLMTTSSLSTLPPGYSLNTDGSYKASNGSTVYGVTYKSGDLTFVYISPFRFQNVSEANRGGLIGHELIHAQNIAENGDMYQNNRALFNLNSELAAYTYQHQFAISIGDQTRLMHVYNK